jgi:hypothetical protein
MRIDESKKKGVYWQRVESAYKDFDDYDTRKDAGGVLNKVCKRWNVDEKDVINLGDAIEKGTRRPL